MFLALLMTSGISDVRADFIGINGQALSPWAHPATGSAVQGVKAAPRRISKVKPAVKRISKVKAPGRFSAFSRFMPFHFGAACYQPAPFRGQLLLGARSFFARERGEVRHGIPVPGSPNEMLEFERDLGIKGFAPVFTVMGQYQFLPRWGIRYSFTPVDLEGRNLLDRSFTFHGRTFTMGTRVRTKWQRYNHRSGLVYNLSRKPSSLVGAFAEWLHYQSSLTIENELTAAQLGKARWDNDGDLAVVGIEVEKCFKSYMSSTIGFKCKGAVTFLDDHKGFEVETSLSYAMPFSGGHFGFIRGGYRYSRLEKDSNADRIVSSMDGAFVELSLLL
jgi:hypothetical protein